MLTTVCPMRGCRSRLGHVTDHWGAAVRQIFAGWNRMSQIVERSVSVRYSLGNWDGALGIESSHDRICEALQTLSRLTPLLMGTPSAHRCSRLWRFLVRKSTLLSSVCG